MGNFESARIMHLAIGMPKVMAYGNGKEMLTAIQKEPVQEVYLSVDGFQGDEVADKKHHGGPDRAVCLYPYEHYAFWEQEFSTRLPKAAFGENLTVSYMLEKDIFIGDIFRIGDAVVQVTQGRVPCHTIDRNTNMTPLLKAMVKTGFTGYMCRVIEEGFIRADSEIEMIERGSGGVSVLYANEVNFHQYHDADAIRKVLGADALAEKWQELLETKLAKLTI